MKQSFDEAMERAREHMADRRDDTPQGKRKAHVNFDNLGLDTNEEEDNAADD